MRGEKYIVNVGPELDSGQAQEWLRSINVLLRSTMIYSLNLEMTSALNVMMDLAGDIVRYDKGIIYMLDEDENKYHPALMRGLEEPLQAQMVQGNIVVDWTVENNQPVRINDPDTQSLEDLAKATGCRSILSVPISHDNKVKGVLQLFKTGAHSFGDEHVRMVWILALQLEGMFHRLLKTSYAAAVVEKDPFTDLPKRAVFEKELEKELIRSRRNHNPFSVLLIEIDHFKDLKSQFMSLEGDIIVREVVILIKNVIRRIDVVSRYSESCIGLILPDADDQRAVQLAGRIKTLVSKAQLKGITGHAPMKFTVSVGVSSFPQSVTIYDLIHGAEDALELAHELGGNVVKNNRPTFGGLETESVAMEAQEILDSMGRFFSLDALLDQMVQFYSRIAEAGRVSILVLDKEGSALHFVQGTGFFGFEEDIRHMSLPLENSISGSVVSTQRPLLVQDIDRAIPKRSRSKLTYTSPSFMSIPLVHRGDVIGVINLSNRVDGSAFVQEDLDRVLTFTQGTADLISEGRRFSMVQSIFFRRTADVLLGIAENKSPYLDGHSTRVANLSMTLAKQLGFTEEEAGVLADSAKFHDLGRIAIDEAILSKDGELEEREREQVKDHPLWSYRILGSIPGMDLDLEAIKSHHERYDGKGYPEGLLGEEIPMGGRILAVVDAFDALTSERPYRPAMNRDQALEILDENSWSQFDGRVVKAFKEMDIEH
jgi:diguanylate cyclase (GGDEF)-like protein